MAVKIRLSRIGTKHLPIFRIVAVDSKDKRDGAFLDNLGTYDAINSKLVQFHADRIEGWVKKGAIMTDSVKKLLHLYKHAKGSNKA